MLRIYLRREGLRKYQQCFVRCRILSSGREPTNQTPTASSNSTQNPGKLFDSIDQALRDNIKNMGAMLGKAVKLQDPEVFDIVEKLRKLGREVNSPFIYSRKGIFLINSCFFVIF